MKITWLVVALAFVGGCKRGEDRKQPVAAPAAAHAAQKPLPGTEAVQSLLSGVGKSAAPADRTAGALGGLFGQGGVLGGGPSRGMGVVGGPAGDPSAKPVDVAAAGDPDVAGGGAPPPPPPPDVALPPPVSAGGDCAAVGARVGELARAMATAELRDVDPETRAMTEEMIGSTLAAVSQMVAQACTEQAWPQELKDCLLTGADLTALQGCERLVTPAMKAQMEAAPPPTVMRPTTPAPVWDGGSTDCAATAAQAAALAGWELSVAPADVQAGAAGMIEQMKAGVEQTCTAAAWPETQRRCVLTAASIDAMNACAGG